MPRLPRFKRISPITAIKITARDRAILRLVHEHRFLRSSHIFSLMGGSRQQILRRLQSLFQHGYLERPRAQLDYYHLPGSRHIIYGLGNKGGTLLKQERGPAVSWGEKNRAVGRVFLQHAVMVSEIMATLELACRNAGIRLLTEHELAPPGQPPRFRWRVKLSNGVKLGVVPDRVFAVELPNKERRYFFLEADRGTMPVMRRNLSHTSLYRKLLAYEATWAQSIHQSTFGFHRFRVLIVTTTAARVKSLRDACSQLQRGHGLFLWADRSIVDNPFDLGAPVWKTATSDMNSLLD